MAGVASSGDTREPVHGGRRDQLLLIAGMKLLCSWHHSGQPPGRHGSGSGGVDAPPVPEQKSTKS